MTDVALLWLVLGALLIAAGLAPHRAVARGLRAAAEVTAVALATSTSVLALVVLTGCGPSAVRTQATAADSVAAVANASGDVLAEQYVRRGEHLIDSAGSREEALALLAAHREEWRPLWLAWDAVAAAHDAYAAALEQGDVDAVLLVRLHEAWCAAVPVAAELGVELPDVVPCGGEP